MTGEPAGSTGALEARALTCGVCGRPGMNTFLELPGVPVHVGVLWPTRTAAVACPRGDMTLAHCPGCAFVANVRFDPSLSDYSQAYDNALHHSPAFQDAERRAAEALIERHDLRGRRVVEVGCGTGHFLGLICALGGNHGVGFDPSHDPEHADPLLGTGARVRREHYGGPRRGVPADLVVCRQVLEHIPDPIAFLRSVRSAMSGQPGAIAYFEVPNGALAFERLSLGDILYEHCSYFTRPSLTRAFREAGFAVLDAYELFDGQFIAVEARVADDPPSAPGADPDERERMEVAAAVDRFADAFRRRRDGWRRRVTELTDTGERVVVWGGGARTVGFFEYLGVGEEIPLVVDINPRKHGTFLPGTGHPVVAPDALAGAPPDTVIVMNGAYRAEIAGMLERLGAGSARLETVLA